MAEITKPSSPGWQRVSAQYRKAKSRHVSPFSLTSQTYVWSGSLWTFTFHLPPMKTAQAADWLAFLKDLVDGDNYFSCNVSLYVPSGVTSPMNLRLADNVIDWDVDRAKLFGITFTAEEYK